MRTLQEKYNGINEGKFTKEQFLRDARMEQPNLVTRFNGYDDAVKILKNRGMIRETYSTEESFEDYSDDALTDMIINSSRFEGNEDVIARVKQELARRKEAKSINEVTPAQEKYRVKPPTQFKQDIAAAKKMIDAGKSEKEVVAKYGQAAFNAVNAQNLGEARLTNKSLTDYRYKPTNDMDKYPYEQILRGLRVELEGLNVLATPTPEEYTKALGKVLKNLEKDSIFYTNQVAGVKANAKRTDLMIDATPKNEVDKENGLKKAALKKAIKEIAVGGRIFDEDKSITTELALKIGEALAKYMTKFEGGIGDKKFTVNRGSVSGPSFDLDLDGSKHSSYVILKSGTIANVANNVHKAIFKRERISKDINYPGYVIGNDGSEIGVLSHPLGENKSTKIKNEVDKENGLKKAALKEAIKGVIKNILSEGNEFGEGEDVYEMYGSDRRIPDDTYIGDSTWYDEEEDDIPHPRGYEEASDKEDFDDLFKENKSEKELRAEWEKYQATCHPEDKMSYMEWRSEQGLDESVSLKDIL